MILECLFLTASLCSSFERASSGDAVRAHPPGRSAFDSRSPLQFSGSGNLRKERCEYFLLVQSLPGSISLGTAEEHGASTPSGADSSLAHGDARGVDRPQRTGDTNSLSQENFPPAGKAAITRPPDPGPAAPAAWPEKPPRLQARRPQEAHQWTFVRAVKDPPVLALTLAHGAAVLGQAWTAKQVLSRYSESYENALTGFPLGRHPTNARMFAAGSGLVLGEMYLAEKMRRSRQKWVREIFWLPQIVTISIHLGATHYNLKGLP